MRAKYVPTNIAFAPGDAGGDFLCRRWIWLELLFTSIAAKATTSAVSAAAVLNLVRLKCPHGIWCDTRNPEERARLVVANRANIRLQYFSLDGSSLWMVTDELRHPCHFDQRGSELLIPDLKGRAHDLRQGRQAGCPTSATIRWEELTNQQWRAHAISSLLGQILLPAPSNLGPRGKHLCR